MRGRIDRRIFGCAMSLAVLLAATSVPGLAQKKPRTSKPRVTQAAPESELNKLRDQYISATKEYKASLEKLIALYQKNVLKAEKHRDQMQKLLEQGLISKHEFEQAETVVADAKLKVSGVENQINNADAQIAQALVEIEGDKEIAKLGKMARGTMVRTGSFIRFTGAGAWVLSQSGKIESFFQQTFKRPLPIAVFGQGAIHNQWRLDHRNAMDISLQPDGPEGQALIEFLRRNGIPFSAFRGAIPGVATGPHIHIGMPSHRY